MKQTSGELFTDYIDIFLKIKQESSGFPEGCDTEEKKQHYIDEYFQKKGIRLDQNKIEKNPGLRALSKLMLNSFWGKFPQKSNMTKVKLVSNLEEHFDMLTSEEIEVTDSSFVSDDVVELRELTW